MVIQGRMGNWLFLGKVSRMFLLFVCVILEGRLANLSVLALPVSLDRTKGIIESCISSYLRRSLEVPETRALPTGDLKGKQFARQESEPRFNVDPRSRHGSPGRPNAGTYGASSHPTPYLSPIQQKDPQSRSRSNSDMQNSPKTDRSPRETRRAHNPETKDRASRPTVFRPLEDYIISSLKSCDCLNMSFLTSQPPPRPTGESSPTKPVPEPSTVPYALQAQTALEPDAKTLLLGDLTENSSWLINDGSRANSHGNAQLKEKSSSSSRLVSSRTPRINWAELTQWYHMILTAGTSWIEQWSMLQPADIFDEEDALKKRRWDSMNLALVDREFAEARVHLQRTLLKATENLLKRPRRPLKKPDDARFLLMLLVNPLLYPSSPPFAPEFATPMSYRNGRATSRDPDRLAPHGSKPSPRREPSGNRNRGPGQHSGIIKRILGLMANLPSECHHYLISWFSRFSPGQFEKIVDLIGGFVTYRLTRQHGRKRSVSVTFQNDDSLIPSFSSPNGNTPAELHAAINGRNQNKSGGEKRDQPVMYGEDWQIRAAARIMSLLFSANSAGAHRKPDSSLGHDADGTVSRSSQPGRRGHMIPISSFYNTLLDYSDLVADFESWEAKTSKFSFCQYPFFLSIWAKIHILEHDARRQMEVKAREAFFNSILSQKAVSQYLVLKVRRDCLVEDSLRSVSEVVWSSQQEIKKGLRIEFTGEEGVDAGGLRKEWFLLLVREVFDPNHGK